MLEVLSDTVLFLIAPFLVSWILYLLLVLLYKLYKFKFPYASTLSIFFWVPIFSKVFVLLSVFDFGGFPQIFGNSWAFVLLKGEALKMSEKLCVGASIIGWLCSVMACSCLPPCSMSHSVWAHSVSLEKNPTISCLWVIVKLITACWGERSEVSAFTNILISPLSSP